VYIVQRIGADSPIVITSQKRPTQVEIREQGEGDYFMRREDGSVIKKYRVTRNRKGSLNIESFTPVGVSGIKTLHLERMLKAYAVIIKYDISKEREVGNISNEIVKRDEIVRDALRQHLVSA